MFVLDTLSIAPDTGSRDPMADCPILNKFMILTNEIAEGRLDATQTTSNEWLNTLTEKRFNRHPGHAVPVERTVLFGVATAFHANYLHGQLYFDVFNEGEMGEPATGYRWAFHCRLKNLITSLQFRCLYEPLTPIREMRFYELRQPIRVRDAYVSSRSLHSLRRDWNT